ncbi:hypothetical protein [Reyranella sp.]|uniref:hypothetical protein n=1 Tax=Reyranella sp. TaxID=1929291 RepID=UPI00120BB086|nr:hypothetical protein [Reyranella sp.]TAJ89442.1 MAG: hypothetical protein EPO50_03490 [Reyranella sp.]
MSNDNSSHQFGIDTGSIYDAEQNTDTGEVHIGGLYSGGYRGHGRGEDNYTRTYVEAPDLGGFTARTPGGSKITDAAELRPTDIVLLPNGMETTVEVARMNGLLGPGALQQAQGQSDNADQQGDNTDQQVDNDKTRQQKDDAEYRQPMHPAAESIMRQVLDTSVEMTMGAAMNIIENDGDLGEASAEEIASRLGQGVDPDQVREMAETVKRGYSEDAYKGGAKAAGVPYALAAEALQSWRISNPSAFREAALMHLNEGSTRHYGEFVTEYIANLDATPEGRARLLRATGPDRQRLREGNNEIIVTGDDGIETSWATAVRQRRIKLN